MLTTLCLPSLAAELPTIDPNRTGSLTLYKYDLSTAQEQGLTENVYLSTGQEDSEAAAAFAPFAIPGVEFSLTWVGPVDGFAYGSPGNQTIQDIYGIENQELVNALGMTANDVVTTKNGVKYYNSDDMNKALSDRLTASNTSTKAKLEAIAARDPNTRTMPLTDNTGKTKLEELPLGVYLAVETKVPEIVTYTVDPFLISLPMTDRITHDQWRYEVTGYPKNLSGIPTLNKEVCDDPHGLSFSDAETGFADVATAQTSDRLVYRIRSTVAQIHSPATYFTRYEFVDKLTKGIRYNQQDVMICWYRDKAAAENDYTPATASAPAAYGTHADAVWRYGSEFFSVSYADGGKTTNMTVKLAKAGLAEMNQPVDDADQQGKYSGWTMVIYYTAQVQASDVVTYGEDGNPNDVTLTWSRTTDGYVDTLTDAAKVYVYALDLTKVLSGGGTAFNEVEFTLENHSNGTGAFYLTANRAESGVYYITGTSKKQADATHFVPDADGRLLVYGLEEDSYILTEVKTASGYTLLKNPITIAVNTSYVPGELCGVLSASATVDGDSVTMKPSGESATAFVPLTVLNTRGFDLPKTGGHGTLVTTVCGVLILAGVVATVVISKRKHEA